MLSVVNTKEVALEIIWEEQMLRDGYDWVWVEYTQNQPENFTCGL